MYVASRYSFLHSHKNAESSLLAVPKTFAELAINILSQTHQSIDSLVFFSPDLIKWDALRN